MRIDRELVAVALACSATLAIGARQTSTDQITVPLVVVNNRPFVDVSIARADGTTRTARFLVDSGGGAVILAEPLARDAGVAWGTPSREEGSLLASATSTVRASLGSFPLALEQNRIYVEIGQPSVLPAAAGASAEGMLPGHILAKYHVVFDYPQGTFTIARPGVLKPRGTPMPMPVAAKQGFPRTEVVVDGKTYGFLIDTGASFTMVSDALLNTWGSAHPDWERHQGAFGEAATLGGTTLETMFVPAMTWNGERVEHWGVTSQRTGTFETMMSRMMTAPIVGSLAGNVLRHYRVELDYPNQRLYVAR
jgi:hypothetical protein